MTTFDGREALRAIYDVLVSQDDGWASITATRVTELARVMVRRRSQFIPTKEVRV